MAIASEGRIVTKKVRDPLTGKVVVLGRAETGQAAIDLLAKSETGRGQIRIDLPIEPFRELARALLRRYGVEPRDFDLHVVPAMSKGRAFVEPYELRRPVKAEDA